MYRDSSYAEVKAAILQAFTVCVSVSCECCMFDCGVSRCGYWPVQVVNCQCDEMSENIFNLKYEKSSRQKGTSVVQQQSVDDSIMVTLSLSLSSLLLLISGKSVFKKAVKLTLTLMPTHTKTGSNNDITFDGKTFTATFTQAAGMLCLLITLCH